ncbi:response regulator [Rossellomorea aquimaris]|uniref:Two-component system response regulator DcuR n=1 Tax=Rossellomorea aquimaris TaxID=189382 RepID=A0A1J6WUF7_9BACI|nr:response regulator [Rossellomorea aquimaris]OIU71859.1 two-component system response regulator DcuR [Rossellomorea aquimaris]
MINVLIVEDDPMVANFNQTYLQDIEGFELMGVSCSIKNAKDMLKRFKIDLILLDVFMPGEQTGMDLLEEIRLEQYEADVILITAAAEVENIQTALRLGVVDYLIKPFEFERFKNALTSYRHTKQSLQQQETIGQDELDLLLNKKMHQANEGESLPKGLTSSTLSAIYEEIRGFAEESFSTDDLAENMSISRVSIRKYLKFLTDIGVVDESLIYGIGRPVYQYKLNKFKCARIKNYL